MEQRAAVDRLEAVLDDVDLALRQLDEGTYGTCRACGQPIAEDRLDADPTTHTCERHPELSEQPPRPREVADR